MRGVCNVWRAELPDQVAADSQALYDAFYAEAKVELEKVRASFGNFAVYDLHSYNHRRDGANGAPANADENPEVNIGTANRWATRSFARSSNDLSPSCAPSISVGASWMCAKTSSLAAANFLNSCIASFPIRRAVWPSNGKSFGWTNGADSPTTNNAN